MKNFACWDRESALEIINPDVDAQPNAFFRAVHTDNPIRRMDRNRKNTTIVEAKKILDEFLEPKKFSLVPVIGDSGSGKSHFVRWINLRIKRDDTREVLFVPKAKTNLRDIVRQLIFRIPEGSQEQYLNMLQGTGTGQLSVEAQRASILNNIQTGLKNVPKTENANLEEYLTKGLSDLFIDPYVREEHFARDGSFAAELGAHVYEQPEGYKPTEKRREFSLNDLPLEVGSLMKAAEKTREFLQFLVGQPEEVKQNAVDIINGHTDEAIARCLNLSGDHLIQIMTEMRQNLKRQGKELVLLIEDFARLQGLDRALLQSILDQGDDEICALRTAFACTTGYYGSLESTVRKRTSFVIDMDNPLGQTKDSFNLNGMVARYMNAVRLGPVMLEKEWEAEKGREASFDIKSHCEECEHQVICHATFGHENGYGLYPFTPKAINVMAHRSGEHVDKHFNARDFQNDVLIPVAKLATAIEGGVFPPKSILNQLGGLQDFPLDEQQNIKRQSPTDADRHLALIALWEGENRVLNVDKRIQEAFNLKPLDAEAVQPEGITPSGGDAPPSDTDSSKISRSREAEELIRWANSEIKMTQQLANDLRPRVFEAVCNFINWDEIGCPKVTWASASSGVFRQKSVLFVRQSTKAVGGTQISLEIPLNWENDDNRTTTYLALTGLIETHKKGSWDIPGANKKFVCLQECLQNWSDHVTQQMLDLKRGPTSWKPASAALELRALAVLLSTPQEKVPDKLDLIELGFGAMGDQTTYLTPELQKVFNLIAENEQLLIKVVKEEASATKGGQVGSFINSSILVNAMKAYKGREFSLSDLPDVKELRVKFHKDIFSIAKEVHSQINAAIDKEVNQRKKWLETVEEAFGRETDEKKISELFRKAITEISSLGIEGSGEAQSTALRLNETNFADAVRSIRNMRKQPKPRPWDLACNMRGAMITSNELINQVSGVLTKAKGKIEATMETQGFNPEDQENRLTEIKDDLSVISEALGGNSNG